MTKPRPDGRAGAGPGAAKSARRRSRELVVQGLYQWLLNATEVASIEVHVSDANPGFDKSDKEYFRTLLHGVIERAGELDAAIAPFLDRQSTALSPVEHAILLLGCFELAHCPEVPYRVVINESVELAKTYGGTDGFRYVNGVLDRVAATLRPIEARAAV
jgi:transcription antitermination protein NusB